MRIFAEPNLAGRIELTKIAEQGHQAVSNLNRLTELGAESRRLELEITEAAFGGFFTDEQREELRKHIEEYRKLTKKQAQPLLTEDVVPKE